MNVVVDAMRVLSLLFNASSCSYWLFYFSVVKVLFKPPFRLRGTLEPPRFQEWLCTWKVHILENECLCIAHFVLWLSWNGFWFEGFSWVLLSCTSDRVTQRSLSPVASASLNLPLLYVFSCCLLPSLSLARNLKSHTPDTVFAQYLLCVRHQRVFHTVSSSTSLTYIYIGILIPYIFDSFGSYKLFLSTFPTIPTGPLSTIPLSTPAKLTLAQPMNRTSSRIRSQLPC